MRLFHCQVQFPCRTIKIQLNWFPVLLLCDGVTYNMIYIYYTPEHPKSCHHMKSKSNKVHSFKISHFQSLNLTRLMITGRVNTVSPCGWCIPCERTMKSFSTTSGEHWQVWRGRLTFHLTFTSSSESYNTFSYFDNWLGRLPVTMI